MTKDRVRGETMRSVMGLGVGAAILQAQRTGKNKGHHLRPAGRWARTWWMLEVAAALGGEAGQEDRACWDGLHPGGQAKSMHSSGRPQAASEGVPRPRQPSRLSDRLEARKETAGE